MEEPAGGGDVGEGIPRVHYDSFFPMEVALGGPLAAHGREMFSRIRRMPHAVVVSQVVVGETHAVLMRRYTDPAAYAENALRLRAAFRDAGADARGGLAPIAPKRILAVMAGLLKRVPELDGTDLTILAVALADPCSVYLLTKDRVLVENEAITAYEEELRKSGCRSVRLKITDMLPPGRPSPARPGWRTRTP